MRVAADDLSFPNGTVITPDGRTLIVGESFGARLTAFDVAEDGSLSNRRVWAQLEKAVPDGICLDAEGAIWVASPMSGEVLRVREGGEVTERIRVATQAIACMLGGPARTTLFVCTSESLHGRGLPREAQREDRGGRGRRCPEPASRRVANDGDRPQPERRQRRDEIGQLREIADHVIRARAFVAGERGAPRRRRGA